MGCGVLGEAQKNPFSTEWRREQTLGKGAVSNYDREGGGAEAFPKILRKFQTPTYPADKI